MTSYIDGWCHQDNCAGFIRARAEIAPESFARYGGSLRQLREIEQMPIDLHVDELEEVRVTTRATDSFRYHHGGSASAAEYELRLMLENFLVRSIRTIRNQFVNLSRQGYNIVMSPDLRAITGYATAHRERTWSQVQAGVKSRFGNRGNRGRADSGDRPPPGIPLTPGSVLAAVDPVTVFLTARVRRSFERLFDLRDVDDSDLDGRIRSALSAIREGQLGDIRTAPLVEVISGDLRWLISDDALAIVGVAWAVSPLRSAHPGYSADH